MAEYRFFINKTNSIQPFDLWKELQVSETELTPNEARTDTYLVASDDVGIKIRGDGQYSKTILEIKVRKHRKKRGAEIWTKIISEAIQLDATTFGAQQLEELCVSRQWLERKHGEKLKQVIEQWKASPPVRITLRKNRRQYHTTFNVLVEQTEFTAVSGNYEFPHQYRTVNMEADAAEDIYALLSKTMLVSRAKSSVASHGCCNHTTCKEKDDGIGCITMSFPSFVRLLERELKEKELKEKVSTSKGQVIPSGTHSNSPVPVLF